MKQWYFPRRDLAKRYLNILQIENWNPVINLDWLITNLVQNIEPLFFQEKKIKKKIFIISI